MKASAFKDERKAKLPPNLQRGDKFKQITGIEKYQYEYQGQMVNAIKVFTDKGEYRTSSGPIMKDLEQFFDEHPAETYDDVQVISGRGKSGNYLALEGI